jgi:hypothetical protein
MAHPKTNKSRISPISQGHLNQDSMVADGKAFPIPQALAPIEDSQHGNQ